jgi:hypothetical protein
MSLTLKVVCKSMAAILVAFGPYSLAANHWSCKFDAGPVLAQPQGSSACGEADRLGPNICNAVVYCVKGNDYRRTLVTCDALTDNTCPSADLCDADSGFVGLGFAQVAKDEAVKEFWAKRDALAERRRAERESTSRVTPTSAVHPTQGRPSR